MQALIHQAIAAALANDWENAITLNQKILQENPHDFDALNRLGYALKELGRLEEAKEIFHRVLDLDPANLIATKNLTIMDSLRSSQSLPTGAHDTHNNDALLNTRISPTFFLEEPGKTKTSNLIRIASKEIIASLRTGLQVLLHLKNSHTIAVMHNNEHCIGYLPDDLAFTLSEFITAGNQYEVFIKSVSDTDVTVFIKEVKKCQKYADIPSFLDTKKLHNRFITNTPRHIPVMVRTDDEDTSEPVEEREVFENR